MIEARKMLADVGGLGPHLEHDQLPADGPLGQQLLHGVDGELLAQLVHDLLDHGLVGPHLDGDAGHGWVVGGAHRQGLNVIALPGEQPGHLAEDAGDVLDQQGEGVELLFWIKGLVHPCRPPYFSRKSVIWAPPATIGRTISSMSTWQSMT